MFRKYITRLLAAALMGATSVSCLDFEPQTQLSDETFWETPNDFLLFSNNFYGWLRNSSKTLYYKDDAPNHSDYYADLVRNTNQENLFSRGENTVPEKDGNYSGNYGHIRRCNMLLENAANYSGSQDDIATYKGLAHFFRAYSYFELVQLYGDAIIVTTPIEPTDPLMNAPRNPRGEVIDLCVEDLKAAYNLLPPAQNISVAGQLSREAAMAFLSRVALYEGTWQKFRGNTERATTLLDLAAKAALRVMQSKVYELFHSNAMPETSIKYLFILEDTKCNPAGLTKSANKEYIIRINHDEETYPVPGNLTHTYMNNACCATAKMADMYLCQNGLPISYGGQTNPQFKGYDKIDSEWENRDNRMAANLMKPHEAFWWNLAPRKNWDDTDTNPYIADFIPSKGTGYMVQKWCVERECQDGQESYDFPVLRYAEVLLNYAEAVYERDGRISDDDLNISLNLVRRRSNARMTLLSNALITSNPGMDMRTEIRRERTVELFLEGFRLDDLKRWKTAETEMPMDMTGVVYRGTEFETAWANCTYKNYDKQGRIILDNGRKWGERNYLNPLPTYELQLNPNLNQNPQW